MNEFIYVLTNPSMPGLVKIGKTTNHPSQRMSELHSTGVPTPFELEFSATVQSCHASEKAAHQALSAYRVTGNRELCTCQEGHRDHPARDRGVRHP